MEISTKWLQPTNSLVGLYLGPHLTDNASWGHIERCKQLNILLFVQYQECQQLHKCDTTTTPNRKFEWLQMPWSVYRLAFNVLLRRTPLYWCFSEIFLTKPNIVPLHSEPIKILIHAKSSVTLLYELSLKLPKQDTHSTAVTSGARSLSYPTGTKSPVLFSTSS